ncbi:hypothetical protein ATO13_10051 [Stappia sp. 22II-S9-Z10]|nr:hypothetical protein ATO13_10051 [Stappia sp. 22II-S9-Z10]
MAPISPHSPPHSAACLTAAGSDASCPKPAAQGSAEASTAGSDGQRTRRRRILSRLWPVGLVLVAMAAFYAAGLHRSVSLDAVIAHHERLEAAVSAHFAATAAAYFALYALAVAVSFPGASLVTIVGGFLFGPLVGTLLTAVAATLGAGVVFLAARTTLGGILRQRAGRFAARFADGFAANAFSYLLFLRLVPLFPFWLVNVAPALFDVKLRTYIAATAIGILPGTLAYTLVGDGLGGLIEAQEMANPGCAAARTCQIEPGALLTPGLVLAIAALSLAALLPVLVKRLRQRR